MPASGRSKSSEPFERAGSELKHVAEKTSEILVVGVVASVKPRATLGDIAMHEVFGEHDR